MVVDLPPGRVRTNLGDDAGTFVAPGERQDPGRQVAGREVVIGMAQARCDHLEPELTLAGRIHVDVDDLPLPRRLPDDRTPCPHGSPFTARRSLPPPSGQSYHAVERVADRRAGGPHGTASREQSGGPGRGCRWVAARRHVSSAVSSWRARDCRLPIDWPMRSQSGSGRLPRRWRARLKRDDGELVGGERAEPGEVVEWFAPRVGVAGDELVGAGHAVGNRPVVVPCFRVVERGGPADSLRVAPTPHSSQSRTARSARPTSTTGWRTGSHRGTARRGRSPASARAAAAAAPGRHRGRPGRRPFDEAVPAGDVIGQRDRFAEVGAAGRPVDPVDADEGVHRLVTHLGALGRREAGDPGGSAAHPDDAASPSCSTTKYGRPNHSRSSGPPDQRSGSAARRSPRAPPGP